MVAYTGIETVSNMAEEARDPGRDIPKAVNRVVVAVLGIYAGISVVALSALPVVKHGGHYATELSTRFENDPVLGIIQHLGLHGTVLELAQGYVGVLAATILSIATNAGLIGISRLSWSLAEHRQLPSLFSQLHSRFRTPWFTIVFFSILAGLLILPGETTLLGNLYSFGAMLSFTTAHVSVIALRYKDPDRERPYRMPWNVMIRGRAIPLTAVLGGIDLRRRRQRLGVEQRRQADRCRRRRLRDLRAARAEPAVTRGGPRGGGGPWALRARDRTNPGEAQRNQDPHGADPHPQPGGGARRRSAARRLRRDLLVDDPRAGRRAEDRPHRRLSAQQAPLPRDHRDGQPSRPTARAGHRLAEPSGGGP